MPGLNQLVDKVRAAHPGAYDDMDDATLTKAVLAKYPQYSDLAAPGMPSAVPKELQPGMVLAGGKAMPYRDAVAAGPNQPAGQAEEAMGFGQSMGDFARNAGKAVAQAAQFAAPIMTGGASLPVQAAVQGATTAAGTAAEGGTAGDIVKSGAIGAAIPAVAEGASALIGKIPSKAAAGKLFASVAQDANKIPVNLQQSHDAALQLMNWQRKTQLGPTINKFLNRITDGSKGPLTYGEARDFYQLFSEMSADEKLKMAGPVKFAFRNMVGGLRQDIGDAAGQVGRAADYYKAMGDYSHAAQLSQWYDTAKKYIVRGAIAGGLGAAGAKGYQFYQEANR